MTSHRALEAPKGPLYPYPELSHVKNGTTFGVAGSDDIAPAHLAEAIQ